MSVQLMLTVPQACERLGVGKTTMYKLLQENKIPHMRIGKKLIRVSTAGLDAFKRQFDDFPKVEQSTTFKLVDDPRSFLRTIVSNLELMPGRERKRKDKRFYFDVGWLQLCLQLINGKDAAFYFSDTPCGKCGWRFVRCECPTRLLQKLDAEASSK